MSEVKGQVYGGWCKQLHAQTSHVNTWKGGGMVFSGMSRDDMAWLAWDFFWKTD